MPNGVISVLEIRFVVSLDELYAASGTWQYQLLEHYGIGIEYIIFHAFEYNSRHVIACEKIWFKHYFDTTFISERWDQMQGNKKSTATKQGLIEAFIDSFYDAYLLYWRTFRALLAYYGVEVDDSNVFCNTRMSAARFPDRSTLDMTVLMDNPSRVISRI